LTVSPFESICTLKLCLEKTSVRGNTCIQCYATSEGFVDKQPVKSKVVVYEVLHSFCCTYGAPQLLVIDNAKEEALGNQGYVIKHYLVKQHLI
jgi:acid stress-induced BolA-like protein IbaG/YrbA